MVKLKGIDIAIISQFDIHRLPEYHSIMMPSPDLQPLTPKFFGEKVKGSPSALASCYVPMLAGSQIWFEYSIEGPHAPEASYFFKLIVNGKVITSWDCTAKHGYHGKMMYNLAYEGTNEDTAVPVIKREALRFTSETGDNPSMNQTEDYVEIRVHRIEHRQKMEIGVVKKSMVRGNHSISEKEKLCFTNSGLVEPHFRPRYYKYQLLDPIDEPYAAFRFFYRTPEFLEENGVVFSESERSRSSSASSIYVDAPFSSPLRLDGTNADAIVNEMQYHQLLDHPLPALPEVDSESERSSLHSSYAASSLHDGENRDGAQSGDSQIPLITKNDNSERESSNSSPDSINSTGSVVHTDSTGRAGTSFIQHTSNEDQSSSPASTSGSPLLAKRALRKNLTINIANSNFNIENPRRPLSPFTRGGFLRSHIQSPMPPSAPAALKLYGPSIDEDAEARRNLERLTFKMRRQGTQRTTREQRNGKSLLAVLGRRIARAQQAQFQAQGDN